jgi:hypothetical protein
MWLHQHTSGLCFVDDTDNPSCSCHFLPPSLLPLSSPALHPLSISVCVGVGVGVCVCVCACASPQYPFGCPLCLSSPPPLLCLPLLPVSLLHLLPRTLIGQHLPTPSSNTVTLLPIQCFEMGFDVCVRSDAGGVVLGRRSSSRGKGRNHLVFDIASEPAHGDALQNTSPTAIVTAPASAHQRQVHANVTAPAPPVVPHTSQVPAHVAAPAPAINVNQGEVPGPAADPSSSTGISPPPLPLVGLPAGHNHEIGQPAPPQGQGVEPPLGDLFPPAGQDGTPWDGFGTGQGIPLNIDESLFEQPAAAEAPDYLLFGEGADFQYPP